MIKRILLIVIIISYCNLGAGTGPQTKSFSDKKFQYLIKIEKKPIEENPIIIIRFYKKDYTSKLASYYASMIGFYGVGYFLFQNGMDGDYDPGHYSPTTCTGPNVNCMEVYSCCLISFIAGTVLGAGTR